MAIEVCVILRFLQCKKPGSFAPILRKIFMLLLIMMLVGVDCLYE